MGQAMIWTRPFHRDLRNASRPDGSIERRVCASDALQAGASVYFKPAVSCNF